MDDCIFCKIAAEQVPSKKLWETDRAVVIENIKPEAPFHGLAIPKKHIELESVTDEDRELLGEVIQAAKKVGETHAPGGYRLIINNGDDSNREIDHLHVHILGGRNLGGLLPS